MRRVLPALFVVITACSGGGQELAPTTSPPAPSTSSTSTTQVAPTSSTTIAPTTTTTIEPLRSLSYEVVAELDFPIQVVPRNDTTSLLATKDGQVYVFTPSGVEGDPVLDISGSVRNQGEQGLLSMAVHPGDDTRLFVHYSADDGDTVVEEYTFGGSGAVDSTAVRQLLRLDQPAANHNGGMLQFGPDGALYLGLGDGGKAGDAFDNGQNRETLLGGIVRLDVDEPDREPTLFQYGLRNPWRFWIEDDLIYVADVGQSSFEEISVVPFVADVNHGWPITEGLHCFRPSTDCDSSGITLPVIEVPHGDASTCSITGGYVYHGPSIPELQGHFLYSDYCGGYLRSFAYEGGTVMDRTDWTDQVGVPGSVVSFGLDARGEVYVLTTDAVLGIVPIRGG